MLTLALESRHQRNQEGHYTISAKIRKKLFGITEASLYEVKFLVTADTLRDLIPIPQSLTQVLGLPE
ncbi:hypothetical protein J6590_058274 [Homalodisca vitripennis]|nr:hypothetical protein J6590_058274 [Homalodisca vitripennis]